jgi:hypothetical protein
MKIKEKEGSIGEWVKEIEEKCNWIISVIYI